MLILNELELTEFAKKIRKESRKTQEEAAKILDVKQPTLAQAENSPNRSLTKLRIRIIEKFGNYKVENALYRISKLNRFIKTIY